MTGFSPKVRKLIAARALDYNDSFPVCEVMAVCQGSKAVACHHRRPRQAGGSRRPETNQAANGLATCDACHSWVELHRAKSYGFGWLVHRNDLPASVPVLRRGRRVLLTDDGEVLEPAAARGVVYEGDNQ